jgi:hypothetical protein
MEVRPLPARRSGAEAALRMDTGSAGNAGASGVGAKARIDGQVSDFGHHGPESGVDRTVLRVAATGAELSR